MIQRGNINQNQMNNKKAYGRLTGWIICCLFVTMTFFSCKKDGPTVAIISVVDSIGNPVPDAKVTLWQDTAVNNINGVQSHLRVTKQSDAAGKAEFNFELEAFLNIEVIKNVDTGRSFIRLKEHETVAQTVHI
jgi:hypothetical protein